MTAAQLELDLRELVVPEYAEEASLAERFAAFHAANPHVADALEILAAEWLAFHDRVSIKALVERLRWESGIQTRGAAYRFDNTHTAFYARLLIQRHPEWSAAIQTRAACADSP